MKYDVKELVELHREQCSRLVNGQCTSVRCLRRGGYRGGEPNYDVATCLEFETTTALSDLERYREALETAKSALDDGDIVRACQTIARAALQGKDE